MPRRIPTIAGILLVLLMVVGFGFLFERVSRGGIGASPSVTPANVTFTNISDSMFTVSWMTSVNATGAIIITGPGAKQTLFDERDSSGKLGTYQTHAVTMRTAQPDTQYELTILSNGRSYNAPDGTYRIRTGPVLPQPATTGLEPAFGRVLHETNLPADGAIVYLTPQGGQTLSALVKSSGSWIIPLNLARTADHAGYLPEAERTDEDILVRFAQGETTAITDTLNDNPVPDMIIGKTYDFRRQQAKAPSGPPSVLGQSTGTGIFAITSPQANAAIPSDLPNIQGSGIPGKPVSITIGITNPISGTTSVGGDGIWRFTPPQRLASGKQSVTASSQNATGQVVAATVLFEVLKSGTQVLGDATPSASLTPSPTLIATQTSTLAGEPVPTSGNAMVTFVLLLIGVALFAGGGSFLLVR